MKDLLMTCYYDDMSIEETKEYIKRVGVGEVSDRQLKNVCEFIKKCGLKEWK